jgi:D-glycero-D-manno-heptose 1,7-bisphosphate phosphatase
LKKALFLDRDGVINIDTGHLYRFEDVQYVDNILKLILKFDQRGYLIFVITNQAGIAKGYYNEKDVLFLHEQMKSDIYSKTGVKIEWWYYCPHQESDNCYCRKPHSTMITNAIQNFNIDKELSFLIGDKITDIEAGINAGVKNCYLLESKYFNTKEVRYKNVKIINNLSNIEKDL